MFQTKANQKKMAEINLFTFPPLDTEHTARWAEVSNPHPGQRNATAPGASTRLTEMVTSLQDLPSNNSSKRHPCHPFNACRCPKNDTQVVCKKCSDFKIWLNKSSSSNVEASWTIWTVSHRVEGLHAIFANPRATREHSKSLCVICGPFWNKPMPIWAVCRLSLGTCLASCHSLSQSLPNLLVWIQ